MGRALNDSGRATRAMKPKSDEPLNVMRTERPLFLTIVIIGNLYNCYSKFQVCTILA